MNKAINSISIHGFKSIQNLDNLNLNSLNILIGSNGAGKSNFISFLGMLQHIVSERFQFWCKQQGGANQLLTFGIKHTPKIEAQIAFEVSKYSFTLQSTTQDTFFFSNETVCPTETNDSPIQNGFGIGDESKLRQMSFDSTSELIKNTYNSVNSIRLYHFHDTSATAGVKLWGSEFDNEYLREDGSNLASFLWKLQQQSPSVFTRIVKTIRLAIPSFGEFVFSRRETEVGEQIKLGWQQKNCDYPFNACHFSDGALRFICLTTALMQPNPPSTIIIDEPEIGLHPYALTLLASLLRSASKRMQVIVATQSVPLVNEFDLEDIIVVERENDVSTFRRLESNDFQHWLEEYSVGDLWAKNILGGGLPK